MRELVLLAGGAALGGAAAALLSRRRPAPRGRALPPTSAEVTAAPIDLQPVAASQVKQGEKVELTVNLERKYGFADPVTVAVALPGGTSGLTISKLTIAKDQKTGKFTITANDKATVGDLALNVEATMKLQNQNIKVTQPLKLKVIEVKK